MRMRARMCVRAHVQGLPIIEQKGNLEHKTCIQ
jgi:hypothetical protein